MVYGIRLFGKTYDTGLFHVATRFFHVMYIPLFPSEFHSHVVLAASDNEFFSRRVPLSAKSVLVTYLRAGLILAGICLVLKGLGPLVNRREIPRFPELIAGLLSFLALVWTYKSALTGRASYDEACRLADAGGLKEEIKTLIGVRYGIAPAEQGYKAIQALENSVEKARQAAPGSASEAEQAGADAAPVFDDARLPPSDVEIAEPPGPHGDQGEWSSLTCTNCGEKIGNSYYLLKEEPACCSCGVAAEQSATFQRRALRFMAALALGVIAMVGSGVLASQVAVIEHDPTNLDYGIIVVVVGCVVGTAVRLGSRKRGGWIYQGMAMIFTYCAAAAALMPVIDQVLSKDQPRDLAALTQPMDRIVDAACLYGVAFIWPVIIVSAEGLGSFSSLMLLFLITALLVAALLNRGRRLVITGPHEQSQPEVDRRSARSV